MADEGVIYHTTEYRERRNHFAYFACSAPLAGFDTQREAFLGAYRGWDRPVVVERGRSADSIAHGWAPCGSHHVELELGPGERRDVVFLLGYAENPADAKFDPPGSTTIDKRRVRPVIERYLRPDEVDAALDASRRALGRVAVDAADRHAQPARRPDDQHLERLPVHGHVQPVPLGVAVRVRPRAGDGLPRLEPGPARVRPHGAGAGPGADPRHRRHPAPVGRRLPPVPAVDQARQRRHRVRLQRRPALADPRRRRLPQGDRRSRRSSTSRCRTTTSRARRAPSTSISSAPLHYTLERLGPARGCR